MAAAQPAEERKGVSALDSFDFDVVVVGGSFAGLAAAAALARQGKRVVTIDAGENRNRFSGAAHNVQGHDGTSPADLLAKARQQYLHYQPFAHFVTGRVDAVVKTSDKEEKARHTFNVTTQDGQTLTCKRVVLAVGVYDPLDPTIPGLNQMWGAGVVHCPFCSGWERRGKELGVFCSSGPMCVHYGKMIAELSQNKKTFFSNGGEVAEAERLQLEALGYTIETTPIKSLVPQPSDPRKIASLVLADERTIPLDALFYPSKPSLPALITTLGIELVPGPFGNDLIKVGPQQETSELGVYAAGDCVQAMSQVMIAQADGLKAGAFAHMSLVMEPPAGAPPPAAAAH